MNCMELEVLYVNVSYECDDNMWWESCIIYIIMVWWKWNDFQGRNHLTLVCCSVLNKNSIKDYQNFTMYSNLHKGIYLGGVNQ